MSLWPKVFPLAFLPHKALLGKGKTNFLSSNFQKVANLPQKCLFTECKFESIVFRCRLNGNCNFIKSQLSRLLGSLRKISFIVDEVFGWKNFGLTKSVDGSEENCERLGRVKWILVKDGRCGEVEVELLFQVYPH